MELALRLLCLGALAVVAPGADCSAGPDQAAEGEDEACALQVRAVTNQTTEVASGEITTRYTACDLLQNQFLHYLDRHSVTCGRSEVLVSWRVVREGCSGWDMRFKYTCRKVQVRGDTPWSKKTGCDEVRSKPAQYLDRHSVDCTWFQALTQFRMQPDGCSGDDMQIHYKCLPVPRADPHGLSIICPNTPCTNWRRTPCAQLDGERMQFLDRFKVECRPNEALMKWELKSCSGREMRFDYLCIVLRPSTPTPTGGQCAVCSTCGGAFPEMAGRTTHFRDWTTEWQGYDKGCAGGLEPRTSDGSGVLSPSVCCRERPGGGLLLQAETEVSEGAADAAAIATVSGEVASEITTRYTACELLVDQSLQYLDRHSVRCGDKELLVSWRVVSQGCSGRDMRFKYTCRKVQVSAPTSRKWTRCNAVRGERAQFLDRHNVTCGQIAGPHFNAFKGFRMERGDCSGDDMRIGYECLPIPEKASEEIVRLTPCAQLSGERMQFLDRFSVECRPEEVLTQWRLATGGCPAREMRFVYTCVRVVPLTSRPMCAICLYGCGGDWQFQAGSLTALADTRLERGDQTALLKQSFEGLGPGFRGRCDSKHYSTGLAPPGGKICCADAHGRRQMWHTCAVCLGTCGTDYPVDGGSLTYAKDGGSFKALEFTGYARGCRRGIGQRTASSARDMPRLCCEGSA